MQNEGDQQTSQGADAGGVANATPTDQQPPQAGWQFSNEDAPNTPVPNVKQHDPVSWTASEYIAHEKSAGWYAMLGLVIAAATALVYLVTREVVSSAVIAIMGMAFGAFAARKPQELDYVLDNKALHIGPRSYTYDHFKSFTVIEEGVLHSIMLMPLQRFMPPLSVYYDPGDETKIVEALQSYLPYMDRKQDYIDKFMRKVRF